MIRIFGEINGILTKIQLQNSLKALYIALYINVSTYDVRDMYDFMDDVIGCSIYLEELLGDLEGKQLGINLKVLHERLRSTGKDVSLVERFIVQVCDVAEVLESSKEMFL